MKYFIVSTALMLAILAFGQSSPVPQLSTKQKLIGIWVDGFNIKQTGNYFAKIWLLTTSNFQLPVNPASLKPGVHYQVNSTHVVHNTNKANWIRDAVQFYSPPFDSDSHAAVEIWSVGADGTTSFVGGTSYKLFFWINTYFGPSFGAYLYGPNQEAIGSFNVNNA